MREALTPLQAADWLAYEVFLATRGARLDRWPMREFLDTSGEMGIYEARDIERFEVLLKTPADEIIGPEFW